MAEQRSLPGDHSIAENLRIWEQSHTWPEDGDEWKGQALACGVPYESWKQSVFDHLVLPFSARGGSILEIACGRGSWSRLLAEHAGRLVLVDLSPACIRHCRQLFANAPQVSVHATDGRHLPLELSNSMDLVWSFDAFVHMDRACVASYLREAFRVLRPGGHVVLHHANRRHWLLPLAPVSRLGRVGRLIYRWLTMGPDECGDGWRSPLSARLVRQLGEEAGLLLRQQFSRWGIDGAFGVPRHRDCVSVFVRPPEAPRPAPLHLFKAPVYGADQVWPAFLCLGAQKAGTTTLHRLLSEHPRVFLPRSKELQYFSLHSNRGPDWYADCFAQARPGQMCGDITPYYLFHPEAPRRIRELLPEARLIVLLRDPVERALAGYFHSRRHGMEPLPLEEALAAEGKRLFGAEASLRSPGAHHISHQFHSYVSRSRYEIQLQRLLDIFPREQLLLIRSEDLFAGDAWPWMQVLDFIGVPRLPLPRPVPRANRGGDKARRVPARVRAALRHRLAPTYAAMASNHGFYW